MIALKVCNTEVFGHLKVNIREAKAHLQSIQNWIVVKGISNDLSTEKLEAHA